MRASNYIPALRYGYKIYPEDIAGMLGLPYIGNVYYVDATNGSDNNGGRSHDNAFASVTAAYAATTDNNHDVVIVTPGGTGSGTGTSESATITWSKSLTHLVGNAAPTGTSNRARIIFTTDSTDPCMTISGQGSIFSNVQLATYEDSNDVLLSLTGNRNVLDTIHFAGIGTATAGDDATARCITLTGAEENVIRNSTIGLDTIARSTSNAEIELAGASARNRFEGCLITGFADNAGHLFVKIGSGGIDRYVMFDNCMFFNPIDSTATTMTVGMSIHASAGGTVILKDCLSYGATDWADAFGNIAMLSNASDESDFSASMGLAINSD